MLFLPLEAFMAKSAMIRARVEPDLKEDAEALLEKLGMTPTEAITLFYKQVKLHRGLPFPVRVPNKETIRAIREARAGKDLVTYDTIEAWKKDMRSL
jgi:DNA-damage-inducible protein J